MSTNIFITGLRELRRRAQEAMEAARLQYLQQLAAKKEAEELLPPPAQTINEILEQRVPDIRSLLRNPRPTARRNPVVDIVTSAFGTAFALYYNFGVHASRYLASGDGSTGLHVTDEDALPAEPSRPDADGGYPWSLTPFSAWTGWVWNADSGMIGGGFWRRTRFLRKMVWTQRIFLTSTCGVDPFLLPVSKLGAIIGYYREFQGTYGWLTSQLDTGADDTAVFIMEETVQGSSGEDPEVLRLDEGRAPTYKAFPNTDEYGIEVISDNIITPSVSAQNLWAVTKTVISTTSATSGFWTRMRAIGGVLGARPTINVHPAGPQRVFPGPGGGPGLPTVDLIADYADGYHDGDGVVHLYYVSHTYSVNTPGSIYNVTGVGATPAATDDYLILEETAAGAAGIARRLEDSPGYNIGRFERSPIGDYNFLGATPTVYKILLGTHTYTYDDLYGSASELDDFYTAVGKPSDFFLLPENSADGSRPKDFYYSPTGKCRVQGYADVAGNYGGLYWYNFSGEGTLSIPDGLPERVYPLVAYDDRAFIELDGTMNLSDAITEVYGDTAYCLSSLSTLGVTVPSSLIPPEFA